jgi:hypothetical protein
MRATTNIRCGDSRAGRSQPSAPFASCPPEMGDRDDRPGDVRDADLRHLREQGLVEAVRIPGYREQAVVLTDRGRGLLESNRDRHRDTGQAFYAGLKRERELEHHAQIYRAYERDAARLEARGLEIDRVRLDYELKREHQQWPHERDRDRPDARWPARSRRARDRGVGARSRPAVLRWTGAFSGLPDRISPGRRTRGSPGRRSGDRALSGRAWRSRRAVRVLLSSRQQPTNRRRRQSWQRWWSPRWPGRGTVRITPS